MLIPRIITALILLPLLLAAIFLLPTPWLYAVFVLVGGVAATEWSAFMGATSTSAKVRYALAMLAVCAAAWWLTKIPYGVMALAAASLLWWLYAFKLVRGYPASFAAGPWTVERMAPLGLLLIPATLLPLAALHAQPNGPWRLMFMFFIVFAADVGAYLVGRNYGKRKLAPAVSPGKSIEGAIGGLVLVALWAVCAGPLAFGLETPVQIALLALVSVATAAVSVVGDLTESLFKRLRGLKDSGTLLPGHGGVLDRIDAILAAAPVFYLGVALLGL